VAVVATLDEIGTGSEPEAQPQDDDDSCNAVKELGSHEQDPEIRPRGAMVSAA
jgi:hypothetical protein